MEEVDDDEEYDWDEFERKYIICDWKECERTALLRAFNGYKFCPKHMRAYKAKQQGGD